MTSALHRVAIQKKRQRYRRQTSAKDQDPLALRPPHHPRRPRCATARTAPPYDSPETHPQNYSPPNNLHPLHPPDHPWRSVWYQRHRHRDLADPWRTWLGGPHLTAPPHSRHPNDPHCKPHHFPRHPYQAPCPGATPSSPQRQGLHCYHRHPDHFHRHRRRSHSLHPSQPPSHVPLHRHLHPSQPSCAFASPSKPESPVKPGDCTAPACYLPQALLLTTRERTDSSARTAPQPTQAPKHAAQGQRASP